ncbi:MAG: HIT family protein, partial [Parasporobacterium sp.]|nr:HIT family protein [Parasporobacterium sp.]
VAKKVGTVLTEVFQADGLNILQNNHEAAGQSVFHFHIHLIPRYASEKRIVFWTPGEQDKEKLDAAIAEIQNKCK